MPKPLTIFILHPSDLMTDYHPHGDGLVAYGFISNLALNGHRLHVAAEQVALRGSLPPNVTLHLLTLRFKHPVLRRVEYALRVRALFERLNRSLNFDVIHQLNPVHAGLSLGMLGAKVPVVLGTFVPRWPDDADSLVPQPRTIQSRLRDVAIAPLLIAQQLLAKALLVVSPAALDRFPLRQFFMRRIYEVHHGIDVGKFQPANEIGDAKDTILFLANLGPRKGMYTLLDAFEIVARERCNARLLIAGSGLEEETMRTRIAQMESRESVCFLGRVSRDAVSEIMSRSSIYCLPSYGEPYATSVLEAMACGKAVVVTNSGGLPYMLPPDGGILVPARDSSRLAAALIALLDDPARSHNMGRANRAFVEAQYAWSKVATQLDEVYRHVIAARL